MYDNQFCIVRCDRAGVFFARVESLDGQTAKLRDARRIWYWAGAASLSQLAQEGTKRPSECRFTVTVPQMTVLQVIEVIPCTAEAAESIQVVPVWKM